MKNIIEYINTQTTIKDKRVYMSLLYINKYILKDTILKDFPNTKYISGYDWFNILNESIEFQMRDINSINTFIDKKIKQLLKLSNGAKYIKTMKEHFKNIGLYEVLADKNTNDFIKFLDTQSISLDSIFEIYTQINMPDKKLNDFFTPMDISDLTSKILVGSIDSKTKSIKICDIACGTGNLLYSAYKKLKEKSSDVEITIFGNDISNMYSSFALSMFNLFNMNNSFFENEDIILGYKNIFPNVKMDLFIGNPPFGQKLSNEQYEYMLLNSYDKHKTKKQLQEVKKIRKVA